MHKFKFTGKVAGHPVTGIITCPPEQPRIQHEAMRRHVFGLVHRQFGTGYTACERKNNIRFRRA